VSNEIFAVVDIGAGTSDIAVLARFDRKDYVLAEDTVTEGGRLLKRVFDRLVQSKRAGVPSDINLFHTLLRDERVRLSETELTADELLSQADADDWVEDVSNRLVSVKKRAQQQNLVNTAFFVESISHHIYISVELDALLQSVVESCVPAKKCRRSYRYRGPAKSGRGPSDLAQLIFFCNWPRS